MQLKYKSGILFGRHQRFPCPSLEEARRSSEDLDACLKGIIWFRHVGLFDHFTRQETT